MNQLLQVVAVVKVRARVRARAKVKVKAAAVMDIARIFICSDRNKQISIAA